jgi:antitoxin (DNA-binding transcriptional repressor) of toxin-antitoxin stability system
MYKTKGVQMKTVTFTEFRKCASSLLTAVEKGEIFIILRHGKPVAEITPISQAVAGPSWKRPGLKLSAKGAELSAAILEERERESIL